MTSAPTIQSCSHVDAQDVAGVIGQPKIRKADLLRGRTLQFRDACEDDAAFINALRTDEEKSRHLSAVSGLLDDQRAWLRQYRQAVDQAYFVIEDLHGAALGTVRLYDARLDCFCWGSWILVAGAPPSAAIESALMVYAYALDVLGFSGAHFQVQRANERVWGFHERFGAQRVAEVDDEYRYTISSAAIGSARRRYQRYLPGSVTMDATQ